MQWHGIRVHCRSGFFVGLKVRVRSHTFSHILKFLYIPSLCYQWHTIGGNQGINLHPGQGGVERLSLYSFYENWDKLLYGPRATSLGTIDIGTIEFWNCSHSKYLNCFEPWMVHEICYWWFNMQLLSDKTRTAFIFNGHFDQSWWKKRLFLRERRSSAVHLGIEVM